MSVLFVSTDLMFGSRASGAAKSLGTALRMVSATQLAEALTPETRLVLLDLSLPVDPAAIMLAVQTASPAAAVVAFGSHVHTARLEAAQAAGCREVLSKGEFNAQMAEVLGRYVTAPPSSS